MHREKLPDRRASWTEKGKIAGQTVYLTYGEYPDGRLGEIFVDAAKQGTFVRGVFDTLARITSVALQCGTPVEEIVKAFKGLSFPPDGNVLDSEGGLAYCVSSVADWIAQVLARVYLTPPDPPPPEKRVGRVSPSVWC